ncbi:hypothetical protein XHC_3203 [Xanthomonas hortorum pv. carotae str. M081]|nr:hypothetical protein XHC_3203 [Xanthomonas hortorum pv. carotae str. M081]
MDAASSYRPALACCRSCSASHSRMLRCCHAGAAVMTKHYKLSAMRSRSKCIAGYSPPRH